MLKNNIILGLFALVTILLVSCNAKQKNRNGTRTDGYTIIVQESLGSNFEIERQDILYKYKPCPANLVRFRNKGLSDYSGLLIGDSVDKRTKMNVLPIACIELMEFEQPKRYFVVIQSMDVERDKGIFDYHSLIARDYQTKNSIEHWLLNRYGIGNVSLKRWLDTDKASVILEASWKD